MPEAMFSSLLLDNSFVFYVYLIFQAIVFPLHVDTSTLLSLFLVVDEKSAIKMSAVSVGNFQFYSVSFKDFFLQLQYIQVWTYLYLQYQPWGSTSKYETHVLVEIFPPVYLKCFSAAFVLALSFGTFMGHIYSQRTYIEYIKDLPIYQAGF